MQIPHCVRDDIRGFFFATCVSVTAATARGNGQRQRRTAKANGNTEQLTATAKRDSSSLRSFGMTTKGETATVATQTIEAPLPSPELPSSDAQVRNIEMHIPHCVRDDIRGFFFRNVCERNGGNGERQWPTAKANRKGKRQHRTANSNGEERFLLAALVRNDNERRNCDRCHADNRGSAPQS